MFSNRPPYPPAAPSGPTIGHEDSTYVFTTITTDPDGNGISYRFAWGDGDTTDWGAWLPSGQTGTALHVWRGPGSFVVSAQAEDAFGSVSDWSNGHQLAIYQSLIMTATATRDARNFMDINYSFSHDASVSSFTVGSPGQPPISDPGQIGPKTANTLYYSRGWNASGNPPPSGPYVVTIEGTWDGGSFSLSDTVSLPD